MKSITGDYKIESIFSGVVTNLDDENLILGKTEEHDLYCKKCSKLLQKYNNHVMYIDNVEFLMDVYFCNKCRIVYELAFIYNKEFKKIKNYISRNNLMVFNPQNITIN